MDLKEEKKFTYSYMLKFAEHLMMSLLTKNRDEDGMGEISCEDLTRIKKVLSKFDTNIENVKLENDRLSISDKTNSVLRKLVEEFRMWNYEWEKCDNNNENKKPKNVDDFIDEISEKYVVKIQNQNIYCPDCGELLIEKYSGVKCSKCDYWFCY